MLARIMQMKNNAVRAGAVDQDDRYRRGGARVRAARGHAVNLGDDIEAAEDAGGGERSGRLLAAVKSSRLAPFRSNISSIHTKSPSLSSSVSLQAADLHNLLLPASGLHRAGRLFVAEASKR